MLDVSTSSSFGSYVDGYHDLDVGNATGRVVTGLSRGTTYYYRVRAYDATGPGSYSETMTRLRRCLLLGLNNSSNVRQFDYGQPKRGGDPGDD